MKGELKLAISLGPDNAEERDSVLQSPGQVVHQTKDLHLSTQLIDPVIEGLRPDSPQEGGLHTLRERRQVR